MGPKLWAGVDIGGTKTAVVLSDRPPDVLCRTEFATAPEHGAEQAIMQIKKALRDMLADRGATPSVLRSIGISCGGPLDRIAGVVQAPPNLPTWIDVPIVDILAREFECPVSIENDANAGAVAEHRYGGGKGTHHMVFLTMGTGLGGGIIINDRLYRGANDMAGEIGHVRLTPGGPVGYHKAGSAEGWASGAGMAQVAAEILRDVRREGRETTLLDVSDGSHVTAKDVGIAALAGDEVACRVVATCGWKFGLALAILVDILNPECIVIGGLAMHLGDLLLEPARKALRQEALEPALQACRLVPAMLGERIGDIAALCIAMDAEANGAKHGGAA